MTISEWVGRRQPVVLCFSVLGRLESSWKFELFVILYHWKFIEIFQGGIGVLVGGYIGMAFPFVCPFVCTSHFWGFCTLFDISLIRLTSNSATHRMTELHTWLILELSLFSGLWFVERFPRICKPLDGLNSSWDSTDVMNFCSCLAEFLPFFVSDWSNCFRAFANTSLVRLASNSVVAHFGTLQAWLTFVRAPLSSRHFMVYGLWCSFYTFLNEILCNSFKDVDRCICYVFYQDVLPFGSSLLYPSSHSDLSAAWDIYFQWHIAIIASNFVGDLLLVDVPRDYLTMLVTHFTITVYPINVHTIYFVGYFGYVFISKWIHAIHWTTFSRLFNLEIIYL